jgi:hypothetical protein
MPSELDAGQRIARDTAPLLNGVHKLTLLAVYREKVGRISPSVSKQRLIASLVQELHVCPLSLSRSIATLAFALHVGKKLNDYSVNYRSL